MPMTPRQRRFVAEYPIDADAAEAAIRAGYSARSAGRTGSMLLRRADVAEAVAAAMKRRAAEAAIDAGWVLRQAVELHRQAMDAGAFPVARSVLDLIGKHVDVQAFREQAAPEHSDYAALTDAEIEARIGEHEAARAVPPRPGEGDRDAQRRGGGGSPPARRQEDNPLHHPARAVPPRPGEEP